MNKNRRNQLQEIRDKLSSLASGIAELRDQINTVKDSEQDYFDDIPERLQGGERGQAAEEAVSNLDTALGALDMIASSAEDADDALDAAMA